MRIIAALLFASCCAAAAQAATTAPQAPASSTSARVVITGWKLECDPVRGTLECRAIDQILGQNGSLVIGFTLTQGTGGKVELTMDAPLGVSVRTPVAVSMPGGPSQNFTFLACSQQGCFATGVLDDGLLAAMRAGKSDLHVTYGLLDTNLAEHEVTATIPLTGFAEVSNRLKQ